MNTSTSQSNTIAERNDEFAARLRTAATKVQRRKRIRARIEMAVYSLAATTIAVTGAVISAGGI